MANITGRRMMGQAGRLVPLAEGKTARQRFRAAATRAAS